MELFKFVYTCNIALILFLNRDVIKFRIPPPLPHNVTLRRPPPPLTCDVIYGWALNVFLKVLFVWCMCVCMCLCVQKINVHFEYFVHKYDYTPMIQYAPRLRECRTLVTKMQRGINITFCISYLQARSCAQTEHLYIIRARGN